MPACQLTILVFILYTLQTTQPSQLLLCKLITVTIRQQKNWPSKMLYTFLQNVPGPRLGQNKSYCEWGFLWSSSKQCSISNKPWLLPSKCQCHISTTAQQFPSKHQCCIPYTTTTSFQTPVPLSQLHNYFLQNSSVISQLHRYYFLPNASVNYTTSSSQKPMSYLNYTITSLRMQCHISTT